MIFQVLLFVSCASTGMGGFIGDRISLTVTGNIPSRGSSEPEIKKTYSGEYTIGQGAGDVLATISKTDATQFSVLIPYDTFQTNFSGVTDLKSEFKVTGKTNMDSPLGDYWSMKCVTIYFPADTSPVPGRRTTEKPDGDASTLELQLRDYKTRIISSSGIQLKVLELFYNPVEPGQKPYVQITFEF